MMPASKAEFVVVTLARFLLHQCEQSDQLHFVEANISFLSPVCDGVTPEPDQCYWIKPAPPKPCVSVNLIFRTGVARPRWLLSQSKQSVWQEGNNLGLLNIRFTLNSAICSAAHMLVAV